MRMIKILGIEQNLILESGKIYNIEIENVDYYKKLYFDIVNENYSNYIYSENYKVKDTNSNGLFIKNISDLNVNDRKILNTLYKKISLGINENSREDVSKINTSIIDLLEDISSNLILPIKYNLELDITKVLSLYNLSFETEESSELLSLLITYIKVNLEIKDYTYIISFNILEWLSIEEQKLLSKELEYMQLSLININIHNKEMNVDIEKIIIDDDLCEF